MIINPNNIEEIADAVWQALEMPVDEQKRRNSLMQERLRNLTLCVGQMNLCISC